MYFSAFIGRTWGNHQEQKDAQWGEAPNLVWYQEDDSNFKSDSGDDAGGFSPIFHLQRSSGRCGVWRWHML